MVKFLHVRVNGIQILHNNGIEESYYAIVYNEKHYFTSVFNHQHHQLQDDIIIELKDGHPPEALHLQRWENCIIIFDFEMDITEIKSRGFIKKKVEGRQGEIINLLIHLYEGKDLLLTDQYLENVSQHYLIIEDLYSQKDSNSKMAFNNLNYFSIHTKEHEYVLPLRASTIVVKLPDYIQIKYFVNNSYNGCSQRINSTAITNNMEIQINKEGKSMAKITLKIKWAVNLHRFQVDQNMLLDSNEILLYDFQFKFDLITEVQGCRLKIVNGNKAFQFPDDIDQNKTTKIKKIVYFIAKTEKEEVDIILTKNGKFFVSCRINTFEISQNILNNLKKKFIDPNNPNKIYGFFKLRAERGKNVSIPQSNRLWRQILKRKQTTTVMMVGIQQATCYYQNDERLVLVGKVQNEQKVINSITNINYFNGQDDISKEILQFNLKGQDSVYLMVKSDAKAKDFIGIGVVNTTELKLGVNPCQVAFFKNQEQTGTINCIINKMVFWPFLKHVFQSQPLSPTINQQNINIFVNKITLSSYYYTFRYDNKRQLYCIIEVNRVKKVLILESNEHDDLNFNAVEGSDQLNYSVEQPDLMKIKMTFLVSDLGHEEEIYGVATCNIRAIQLEKGQVNFKNVDISNDYSVNLGAISLQVFRGETAKPPIKPKTNAQKEKKSIFDMLSQDSFDSQFISQSSKIKGSPSRRYSGGYVSGTNSSKPSPQDFLKKNTNINPVKDFKLPMIKEKKKSVDELFLKLKVRKRGLGGAFMNDADLPKQSQIRRHMQSFDLKKIQDSNPNINRNLQILFPRKDNERQIESYRAKKNDYEDRLKGLKSVMNEMDDIGQVQPSIRQNHLENDYYDNLEEINNEYYQPPVHKKNQKSISVMNKQRNDKKEIQGGHQHSQELYKPIYESEEPQYEGNDQEYYEPQAEWEGNEFAN